MTFRNTILETTEEDRAIISLSSAIYSYLQKYTESDTDFENEDDEEAGIIRVGKIGHHFNTPLEILGDINIELQTDDGIESRVADETDPDVIRDPSGRMILGLWEGNNKTMVLNIDYLSTNAMKGTISHELRHALDDFKSDFKASASQRYATPKSKNYRITDDPSKTQKQQSYLAQPAEINARFLEVMHSVVLAIQRSSKMEQNQIRPFVMNAFKKSMEIHRISTLFPEKTESKEYKRLLKRAVDFIDKELAHVHAGND